MKTDKIKILVNPIAGNGAGKKLLQSLSTWHMQATQPKAITAQLTDFLSSGDTLIIAGGDGTVNLLVNSLYEIGLLNSIKVALLPLGTGNDLALALGLRAQTLPQLLNTIITREKIVKLPLWRFQQHLLLNYLSFGIDAKILADVVRWRRYFPSSRFINKNLYFFAGLKSLFYFRRTDCCFDHGKMESLLALILLNIPSYAGGCVVEKTMVSSTAPKLACVKISNHLDLMKLILTRFTRKAFPSKKILPPFSLQTNASYAEIDGELIDATSARIEYAGELQLLV